MSQHQVSILVIINQVMEEGHIPLILGRKFQYNQFHISRGRYEKDLKNRERSRSKRRSRSRSRDKYRERSNSYSRRTKDKERDRSRGSRYRSRSRDKRR